MFSGTSVDCEGEPESRDLTPPPPKHNLHWFQIYQQSFRKGNKIRFYSLIITDARMKMWPNLRIGQASNFQLCVTFL